MNTVDKIPKGVRDVVLRVDYNFPLSFDGSVSDVRRVDQTRRTIEVLWSAKKRVRIITHWGRPDGVEDTLSTRHLVAHVEKSLGLEVVFDGQPLSGAYTPVDAPLSLCENVRFHPEEMRNDPDFVKLLAQRGEVFVNEAFSVSHRHHASVCGLLHAMPAYIGFGCAHEWQNINVVRERMADMIVFVGGNKVETKLPLICKLLPHVRQVLLGPLVAKNMEAFLRKRHTDSDAKTLANALKKYQGKITIPLDICTLEGVFGFDDTYDLADMKDIGPRTIEAYTDAIFEAGVVFMNGPMGQYERPAGAQGTRAIGDALVHMANRVSKFYALLGGGDTVAALSYARNPWPKNICCSTAGGALLHAMTHGSLPGLEGLCG